MSAELHVDHLDSTTASSSSSETCVTAQEDSKEVSPRPLCRYGSECYRKNPAHFKEYAHPGRHDMAEEECAEEGELPPASKKRRLSTGAQPSTHSSSPPLYYLSRVRGIPDRHNKPEFAIGIRDLLSPSMGDLVASAQFNYLIDINWLVRQYPEESRTAPLLVVHGCQRRELETLRRAAQPHSHIKLLQAKLEMFGTHHSKMMLLAYREGMRVVIHTGNLIEKDWDQKTQGVWVSPLFYKSSAAGGTSRSHFQKDLLEYLDTYPGSALDEWKQRIREHNMTTARVHLIASVPGAHSNLDMLKWGHFKMRSVLQRYGPKKEDVTAEWPVVGQFSSVGSLGRTPKQWLLSELLGSMAICRHHSLAAGMGKLPSLQLVFPTVENIRTSLEGYQAGGSVPYAVDTAQKQPYLTQFLCQWKADHWGRSRASPHIKTYMRVSPDCSKLSWFLLTSANLSKAAWGATEKKGSQLRIRSYEIGVLFLPHEQEVPHDYFPVSPTTQPGERPLPIPVDLPLTAYQKDDKPWLWNAQYLQPDSLGNVWTPS